MPSGKKAAPTEKEIEEEEARLDAMLAKQAGTSELPSRRDASKPSKMPSRLDSSRKPSVMASRLDGKKTSEIASRLDDRKPSQMNSRLDSSRKPSQMASGLDTSKIKTAFTDPHDIKMASRQIQYETLSPDEQRKQEQWAQTKARQLGPCPAGYAWIRVPGGYNCSAGSHWMTDELLAEGKGGILYHRSEWIVGYNPSQDELRQVGFNNGMDEFRGPEYLDANLEQRRAELRQIIGNALQNPRANPYFQPGGGQLGGLGYGGGRPYR